MKERFTPGSTARWRRSKRPTSSDTRESAPNARRSSPTRAASIAGATRIVSALDDVPGGVIPPRQATTSTRSLWRTLRLTPFRAALAASLMLAVASLLVVRHVPPENRTDSAVATPAMVPAMASPAPDTLQSAARLLHQTKATDAERSRVAVATTKPQAPPAAAPTAVVDAAKSVAAAEPKPTVAVDSTSSNAPLAEKRVADARSSVQAARSSLNAAGAAGAPPAADAMNRAAALRREVSVGQPGSLVAASADERPIETPGCFQLVRDSADALPQIPQRFSLELVDEAGARQNVVRAVTLAGRRDSVITGITWRLAPGATRVVLINNQAAPPVMAFQSQATPTGRGARRESDGATNQSVMAHITRVDCR